MVNSLDTARSGGVFNIQSCLTAKNKLSIFVSNPMIADTTRVIGKLLLFPLYQTFDDKLVFFRLGADSFENVQLIVVPRLPGIHHYCIPDKNYKIDRSLKLFSCMILRQLIN